MQKHESDSRTRLDAEQEKIVLEQIRKQLQKLESLRANPATGPNEIMTEARGLANAYQDLETRVDGFLQETV